METGKLKKGKKYLYTAGIECIKVAYLYRTSAGAYLFTDGAAENELSRLSVENYIENCNTGAPAGEN